MSDPRTAPSAEDRPDINQDVAPDRTHPSGPLDGTVATVGHVSNVPAKSPPPQVIAHYELREKLGEGGMGAVYKGWHPKMQRFGAVKLLPAELLQNPLLVVRFEHEVALAAKLDHPHVVRTLDAGEEAGVHYLVLEYLEGTDLSKLVKQQGPLSVANALMAIRQAALGMHHAHEHGLVHRDIKPANLMLHRPRSARGPRASDSNFSDAREPRAPQPAIVKVMDFGLALLTDGNSLTELTKSGQIMGTPEYMAPEQWESTHEVDPRADLYSLGATLHFLLTGHSPYRRSETTTVLHLAKSHALDPIPDLTAARPEVPAEVNALFQRLMAKSPADRPPSATEVVREIDAIVQRSARGPRAMTSATSPAAEAASSAANPNRTRAACATEPEPTQTLSDLFDAIEADQRTMTLAPTSVAPQGSSRGAMTATLKRRLIAAGFLAFVVLTGIIIKITNKDGRVTEINVEDGAKIEITTDDRRMGTPARPSHGDDTAKTNEDKTGKSAHPPDRDDWPEWAQEMKEPPPLEEWLRGRKVLTVKQDGSAMFQTIQAALDKVQPGEVIRVLDKGPYRERLVSRNHPGNFGLVSDVNTVIEVKLELEPSSKVAMIAHDIRIIPKLRITGFTFVCTSSLEQEALAVRQPPDRNLFVVFEMPDLCLEDCVMLAPQREDDAESNLSTPCRVAIHASGAVCVRRCVFGTNFGIGWHEIVSNSYSAIVTQNFFRSQIAKSSQFVIGLEQFPQRAVIERNVFHTSVTLHALQIKGNNEGNADDRWLLSRNSFASNSSGFRTAFHAYYGLAGDDVIIRENLIPPATGGFCFASDSRQFAASAREKWIVRNNWGGRRESHPDWVPLTDPAHTGELPYLSLDPEHPNFLRLDPDKLPSGVKNIPGALPPGPPPPEGDWFTRLQARLKEAQAASRAQFK